jgi:hypothetical protein
MKMKKTIGCRVPLPNLCSLEMTMLGFLDQGFSCIWKKQVADIRSNKEDKLGYLILTPFARTIGGKDKLLDRAQHHFQAFFAELNDTFTPCLDEGDKGSFYFNLKQQCAEFEKLAVRLEDELVRMVPISTNSVFNLT